MGQINAFRGCSIEQTQWKVDGFCRSSSPRTPGIDLRHGDREGDSRADVVDALELDGAPHQIYERFANTKTQTTASETARGTGISLGEWLKKVLYELCGDANTRVRHPEDEHENESDEANNEVEANLAFFRHFITDCKKFIPELCFLSLCASFFWMKEWGPNDWPPASLIDLGTKNGIRVQVVKCDDRVEGLDLEYLQPWSNESD